MADGEIDPRYAARFRRGYDPDAVLPAPDGAEPEPEPGPLDDAEPARPTGAPRVVVSLLGLAVVLATLTAGSATWAVLDLAFLFPPVPDPLAPARAVARVAPGPLLVGVVAALASALLLADLSRRVAVPLSAVLIAAVGALPVRAAVETTRLASLTLQGPVSSGGIPLPPAGIATYHQRVQAVAVLDAGLPWLVLAAVLALVVAVLAATGALSRRPTA